MSILKQASLLMIPSGYKEDKLYSILPKDGSGDLSFARSSSATRVNDSGVIETVATNTPRIDYTGGGCGKLLLEPQRTNTIRSNSDYTQTWAKVNVLVTANATTSPNGSNDAQKLTSANAFGQHYIREILGGHTVGAPHVFSCFAKAAELDIITLRLLRGGGPNVNFDLTNGTHNGGANGKMIDFGNGWYRCITYHPSAEIQYLYPYIYTQTGNTQGDGASGFYVYGAMIEEGDYETSLIDTTTTAVTRVADTSSTSGLSSVINSVEGVLFAEISAFEGANEDRQISISDGSTSNRVAMALLSSGTQIQFVVSSGGSITVDSTQTIPTITSVAKIAFAYKANDFKIYSNGVLIASDTSGAVPTGLNTFSFDRGDGGDDFYGNVNKVTTFNTALSNSELAALTTL